MEPRPCQICGQPVEYSGFGRPSTKHPECDPRRAAQNAKRAPEQAVDPAVDNSVRARSSAEGVDPEKLDRNLALAIDLAVERWLEAYESIPANLMPHHVLTFARARKDLSGGLTIRYSDFELSIPDPNKPLTERVKVESSASSPATIDPPLERVRSCALHENCDNADLGASLIGRVAEHPPRAGP